MSAQKRKETWQDTLVGRAADRSLAQKVCAALTELLIRDADLLIRNVNERAITARLADHLRSRFSNWHVDAEYNRDGHEVKKANGEIIVPDVIIHRRGTSDNLLVIEVKKSNTTEADGEVLKKLKAIKSDLRYRHALFVKFIVGRRKPGVERVRWMKS